MEIDLFITLRFIGGAAPVNPCPRSARGGAVFFIVVGAFSRPKFIDEQGYFIDVWADFADINPLKRLQFSEYFCIFVL